MNATELPFDLFNPVTWKSQSWPVEYQVGFRLASAQIAGCQAFKAGKARVPAQDKNLTALLAGVPVGKLGIQILDKWLAGWDEANLASSY